MRSNTLSLDEVLYQFSLEQDVPDAALIDKFVRAYPEHAAAITDFAVEMVLDSARENNGSEETLEVTPAVSRAMSRFQNTLYAAKQSEREAVRTVQSADVVNPFGNLDRPAFRNLAGRMNANTVFIAMLRDREIDLTTMTPGFQRLVADETKAPLDVVVAHLAAEQRMPAGQYYKASEKPEVKAKISFQEAVRSCGLSDEQQSFLLSL